MRTATLAMIVVAASAIAYQARAPQQAAPSDQTKEEMHTDVDKGLKTSEPNEQMQRDADKGAKTRNSGASRYVADQDKPGASRTPRGSRQVSRRLVRGVRPDLRNKRVSNRLCFAQNLAASTSARCRLWFT